MRGEITLRVLEKIEEGLVEATEIFAAYLNAGYGASFNRLRYEKRKLERKRIKREIEEEARQNYYKFIYKLKKDGLIKKDKGKLAFFITKKGVKKLEELRRKKVRVLPINSYKKAEAGGITIVIFDIPEDERDKRRWLRNALRDLGFALVQKSVWVGKGGVPREFLDDLFKFEMIDYVEVFQVSREGSLKRMNKLKSV